MHACHAHFLVITCLRFVAVLCVDPLSSHEYSLPFEGFLEALCRTAALKALPTDEEISSAGCQDAGEYVMRLRATDEEEYQRIQIERCTPWGQGPSDLQARALR